MYVSASESRVLARIFGLLSEDLSERDVREAVGHHLLELLEADHYASFVWQDATGRFEKAVYLNMDPANIAAYDRYYQQHDPITSKLQARREATLVTQVMPQRELMRTEFFNDFLARDGLHWGVNAYSYVGGRNIGDVRIWRGRRRENFDGHTLELLRLIEPAFTGALVRAAGGAAAIAADGSPILKLSVREFEIARMISDDLSDKEIAHRLQVEVSTVRTHIERIFAKLGVRRRSGVASLFAQALASRARPSATAAAAGRTASPSPCRSRATCDRFPRAHRARGRQAVCSTRPARSEAGCRGRRHCCRGRCSG